MTAELTIASQIAEYTTVVQNVVLALSAVATVWIAYSGLTTWRKELKGKSEYTKAKEILKAVYKVRQAFMVVRGPAIFTYEYPEKMLDESGQIKKGMEYDATAHVYEERWKIMNEAFRELENQTLHAQVEWGSSFQEIIVPLRKCRGELQLAIQDMLRAKREPYERRVNPRLERDQQRSILYYVGENFEHDKFTPEINSAIEKFEIKLRPQITK